MKFLPRTSFSCLDAVTILPPTDLQFDSATSTVSWKAPEGPSADFKYYLQWTSETERSYIIAEATEVETTHIIPYGEWWESDHIYEFIYIYIYYILDTEFYQSFAATILWLKGISWIMITIPSLTHYCLQPYFSLMVPLGSNGLFSQVWTVTLWKLWPVKSEIGNWLCLSNFQWSDFLWYFYSLFFVYWLYRKVMIFKLMLFREVDVKTIYDNVLSDPCEPIFIIIDGEKKYI